MIFIFFFSLAYGNTNDHIIGNLYKKNGDWFIFAKHGKVGGKEIRKSQIKLIHIPSKYSSLKEQAYSKVVGTFTSCKSKFKCFHVLEVHPELYRPIKKAP